ncbi:MAG: hypothetical protein ACRDYF_09500, partial [Acidimicrobiia bacterium]
MNEYSDSGRQLEEDLATAAALISAADQVALACHVAPDGDALGSMSAGPCSRSRPAFSTRAR